MPTYISGLPNELLISIFEVLFCMPPYGDPSRPMFPYSLELLLVCKQWWALITNTPSLWTQISLTSISAKRTLRLAQIFIERSQDARLTIKCALEDDLKGEDGQANLQTLELIRSQMYRVESLDYHGSLDRFFPLDYPIPHLRRLRVELPLGGFYAAHRRKAAVVKELFSQPMKLEGLGLALLQDGQLDNPLANIDPLALTRLELMLPLDRVDATHFLTTCKNLAHLTLLMIETIPAPATLISFPLLVKLRFVGPAKYMSTINAPQLACLSLEYLNSSHWQSDDGFHNPAPFYFPHLRALKLVASTGVTSLMPDMTGLAGIEADGDCDLLALLESLIGSAGPAIVQRGAVGIGAPSAVESVAGVVSTGRVGWAPNLHLFRMQLCDEWGEYISGMDQVVNLTRSLLRERRELKIYISYKESSAPSDSVEGYGAKEHHRSLRALAEEFSERIVLACTDEFVLAPWEDLLYP